MADYGTVMVRVYTSRAQIPLEGATVAVTQKRPSGKHEVISVQIADENGKIRPVTIPTPPPAESEAPGQALPFARCDVWADHESYELLIVEDVQVFGGVETMQNMELIPLPEHVAPREAVDEVTVTPQSL